MDIFCPTDFQIRETDMNEWTQSTLIGDLPPEHEAVCTDDGSRVGLMGWLVLVGVLVVAAVGVVLLIPIH